MSIYENIYFYFAHSLLINNLKRHILKLDFNKDNIS